MAIKEAYDTACLIAIADSSKKDYDKHRKFCKDTFEYLPETLYQKYVIDNSGIYPGVSVEVRHKPNVSLSIYEELTRTKLIG